MEETRTEAVELRDKVWMYSQRGVVALVLFLAGVFAGYQMWGQAYALQLKVEELEDKAASLVKERDTLRSKIALVERDKNEALKQMEDQQGKLAAAEAKLQQLSGGAAPAPH